MMHYGVYKDMIESDSAARAHILEWGPIPFNVVAHLASAYDKVGQN